MRKVKNKNQYCTFYIVRHGETEANVKGVLQGQSDSPLTKAGKLQTKEASIKLSHIHFDEAFSSDLYRAKHTADLLLLGRKISLKTSERLRERGFGKHEGKSYKETVSELKNLWTQYERLSNEEKFKFKFRQEGESDEELAIRMITLIRELGVTYPSKTILIVSHGGIMKAFLIHLGFGNYETLQNVVIKNLAWVKLRCDGVDFFIEETQAIERIDR